MCRVSPPIWGKPAKWSQNRISSTLSTAITRTKSSSRPASKSRRKVRREDRIALLSRRRFRPGRSAGTRCSPVGRSARWLWLPVIHRPRYLRTYESGRQQTIMFSIIVRALFSIFKSRESLILENAALCHQISILQRNSPRQHLKWRDMAFSRSVHQPKVFRPVRNMFTPMAATIRPMRRVMTLSPFWPRNLTSRSAELKQR